jgi:hypothetical protein
VVILSTLQDKSIIQKVKSYQKITVPPQNIAKSLKISIEDVCKILGYDVKTMDKEHRDYCFYDHGSSSSTFEIRLETYGLYLEEGDFEKFQPACYMDRHSEEFLKLKNIANSIPISNDPVHETRRVWLLNRFTDYRSKEWIKLRDAYTKNVVKIPGSDLVQKVIDNSGLKNKEIQKLFE